MEKIIFFKNFLILYFTDNQMGIWLLTMELNKMRHIATCVKFMRKTQGS